MNSSGWPVRIQDHRGDSEKHSSTMKHKISNLSIHQPLPRVALILNLVVSPQMPLAAALTAPEGVIRTGISWHDLPRAVGSSFGRNTTILHLVVFAGRAVRGGCGARERCSSGGVAVCDVICCGRSRGRSGRVDICSLAVGGHRLIEGPLERRIKVSKRVHCSIQAIVVEASVAGIAGVLISWTVVAGAVWVRVEWRVVYPVGSSCGGGSHDACASVGNSSSAIGISSACRYTSRESTVCLLSSVGEDAALAVARRVEVLVARSRVRFHFAVGRRNEQSG
jgi:hypothetical protein